MSLTSCPECGAQVSTKARTCPKCGVPLKKGGGGCAGCLIGCLVLLLILAGGAYFLYGLWEENIGDYRDQILEKIEEWQKRRL